MKQEAPTSKALAVSRSSSPWILLGWQDGEIRVIHYFSVIPLRNSKVVKWEELSLFQYIRWLFNTKNKIDHIFLKDDDEKNGKQMVPKDEEIVTLIKLLNKYSPSERYNNVMKNEKDASLKRLLLMYKESFLEDILRTEILTYKEMSLVKDISIENPEVGDLAVAIGRLRFMD